MDVGVIKLVLFTKRVLRLKNGQGRDAGRMVGSGRNGHMPFFISVDAAVSVTSVSEKQYRDAPARCPAPEGQERYTYEHARAKLRLCWH